MLKPSFPFPSEILAHLDRFIIGQDQAKRKIAGAAYEHFISQIAREKGLTKNTPKGNILIFGPTGSGKTLIVKTLAAFLGLPFLSVDLTHFSSAGYVGKDIGSILRDLVLLTPNTRKAERAIVFFDEFDKIAGNRGGGEKDVAGFALQAELLKLLEGGRLSWTDRQEREYALDVTGVFFVFAGAFPELPRIIQKRLGGKIGFPEAGKGALSEGELLAQALPQDFDQFGFLPEILGRMKHITALNLLGEQEMCRILERAEGSPLKSVQAFFNFHGIDLSFSKKALKAISRKALALPTGARALASVLGASLEGLQFRCPELQAKGVEAIHIQNIGDDLQPKFRMKRKAKRVREKTGISNPPFFKSSGGGVQPLKAAPPHQALNEALMKLLEEKKARRKKGGNEGNRVKGERGTESKEELLQEREKVKRRIFQKIREDERSPRQKIPLVSSKDLISLFLDLYEKEGKETFDLTMDLIQSRGETLSMFHLMMTQSGGKELGTVLKYWDYWDALQEENPPPTLNLDSLPF